MNQPYTSICSILGYIREVKQYKKIMTQIRILHGEIIICRYCLLIYKVITLQLKKTTLTLKKKRKK